MTIQKSQWIGIISAVVLVAISAVLLVMKFPSPEKPFVDINIFYFIIGLALVIAGMPFFTNLLVESKAEREKEQMFLEFARDLVEGVRAGTPISKSILNIRTKDYGSLSINVVKLANQISIGIPVKDAFEVFAKEVNNNVVSRSVGLIREAERSGGRIELVLESVTSSVSQIEKLKKERKAAIYNLTVQGYIIFLIFIAIMLVMQFKILPIVSGLGAVAGGVDTAGLGVSGFGAVSGQVIDPESLSRTFLYLLLTQGFFAGLVIGKISEGTVKAGFKHSFILVSISWLISTGATAFLGFA